MRVVVHEAAAAEFHAAVEYYERRVSGLGSDLAVEVAAAFDEIADSPERWPVLFTTDAGESVRRRVLRRFPMAIFYLAANSTPVILAVAHERQRPGFWQSRLGT